MADTKHFEWIENTNKELVYTMAHAAGVIVDNTGKVLTTALNEKVDKSEIGVAGGLAQLDASGKIPSTQLPGFVDDVIEYDTLAHFPEEGESGKIYIALDTNMTYRWSGTQYVVIGTSLSLGETETTAYRGDRGHTAYLHSQTAHAPADAQKNVNADWDAVSGDAAILHKPTIPPEVTETTVTDWGFTKNTGNYTLPATGIPKSDLATDVQTSLNKADSALQSFIETDPTVPAWAKEATKPSYTAAEVGAATTDHNHDERYYTESETDTLLSGKVDTSSIKGAAAHEVVEAIDASADLPTSSAVKTYVDQSIANLPEPMVFKGSLGEGGTITELPTAAKTNEGHTYKVITAGTYAGVSAKLGDTFISDGKEWVHIPSGDESEGTVVSVGLSMPDGFTVSGSPIVDSGILAVTLDSNKVIPETSDASNWDTAYTHSQTAHAPADAQKNVQADWNATEGDALILNKPASLPASDVAAWAKEDAKPEYSYSEIKDAPQSLPASDVAAWAKAANKPEYTAQEVGADPAGSAEAAQTAAMDYVDEAFSEMGEVATLDKVGTANLSDGVLASLAKADSALQSYEETDPTVPSWAKAESKPSYDYSEILNTPESLPASDVPSWAKAESKPTYTSQEVGADPAGSADTALSSAKAYTDEELQKLGQVASLDKVGTANLSDEVVASLGRADSALQSFTETDPTVPSWAKAANKPEYSWSEITNKPETFAPAAHDHDSSYYTKSVTDELLSNKLDTSLKGAANGLAELGSDGKVLSSQLPGFVDDVLEYASEAEFPEEGESGKIYVAADTNKTYRWSGTTYVVIGSSLALGETSSSAYRGDLGKIAYDHSQAAHAPVDAQKNVNADWNATEGDAEILNKPDIPSVIDNVESSSISDALSANQGRLLESGKANKPISESVTLLATSWTGDTPPYSYDLGIATTYDVEVIPSNSMTYEQYTAAGDALISGNGQDNILRAWGNKPTVDIPVIIRKVVK